MIPRRDIPPHGGRRVFANLLPKAPCDARRWVVIRCGADRVTLEFDVTELFASRLRQSA